MPAPLGYVPGIDGLRAVAVLLVLGWHVRPALVPGGYLGVDVFFVISGFAVSASLAGRRFNGFGPFVGYFWSRRVCRILPALLLMLCATSLLATLFSPWLWLVIPTAAPVAMAAAIGASNLVLAASPESYFGGSAQYSPFVHSWSLGVEEQFYLLFPVLLWLCRSVGSRAAATRAIGAASVGSFALYAVAARMAPAVAFNLMPARFWELGAGMLLWLTLDRWRPFVFAMPVLAGSVAGLAAMAALIGSALLPGEAAQVVRHLAACTASAALMIAAVAVPAGPVSRLLSTRPALNIGRASYSLYLWHIPIIVLFRWTVGLQSAWLAAGAVIVSSAAAAASYRWVEQPFRRIYPRAESSAPAFRLWPTAALACLATVLLVWSAAHVATGVILPKDALVTGASSPKTARCAALQRSSFLAGGERREWLPGCGRSSAAPRWVVLGDSHALVYARLLERHSKEAGAGGTLLWRAGCPFPDLAAGGRRRNETCGDWDQAALASLLPTLRAGDVVFLSARQVPRLDDALGAGIMARALPPPHELNAAISAARGLLTRLLATGASVIVEAPQPLFRSAPYRCSAWYNRTNPACAEGFAVSRTEEENWRRPSLLALRALTAGLPRTRIFDPFPALCPADPCQAFRGGHSLYFDDSHISTFAVDALYPAIATAIRDEAGKTGGDQGTQAR